MAKDIFSTVSAISTPRGRGGIAVIRISGSESADVVNKIFVPMGKASPKDSPRRAVYGKIVSPTDGRMIDSGICVFYASPASFTGEDMAEISCHGGLYVTRAVLEATFQAGAEPAGPGEFTRRAFISGKLTLSEAQAVGMLIDADTEERASLAAAASGGALSGEISRIAGNVSSSLAQLYASIDYPDEDIGDISPRELCVSFSQVSGDISRLLSTYRHGSAVADGIPTAIIGRPNGGKSSLYNLLCGEDRAIVTDIAGTTRDILRETVSFAGVTLLLSDTAGLCESEDTVERIGIERAIECAKNAGLVLFVYDLSDALSRDEADFARKFTNEHPHCVTVAVFNKTDLDRRMSESDEKYLREIHKKCAVMSVKTGDGLASLSEVIGEIFESREGIGDRAMIWSMEQKASLERAQTAVDSAILALSRGEFSDAACTLAEEALGELLRVDGRGVSEEIVSSIFARFCVGK